MSKAFAKSLSQLNKALVRRLNALIIRAQPPPARPPDGGERVAALDALPAASGGGVAVCKVEGGLLKSSTTFPYFMLVALEAGGLLRGLFLLLLYPFLRLLGHGRAIKAMAAVSFVGLRKDAFGAGRAALPRLLLEDVSAEVFDAVVHRRRRFVCVSAMPRVMVEPFLREYLGVDATAVVAPEMREIGGRYLGVMQGESEVLRGMDVEMVIAREKEKAGGGGSDVVVGVGGLGSSYSQLFHKHCKEVYVPTESARRRWHALPRRRYPKPLIFHDGRIAFRPTPAATLAMFMWLPLGLALAVARMATFLLLPFCLSVPLLAALGMHSRLIAAANSSAASTNLFACNHRSLIDPLYVSAAAGRANLAAATYSISRLSEILSPIPTFRLTRDRAADRAAMQAKLSGNGGGGGLVVCPEGTTCREPFLLRFSPLFAELGRDVTPVALHSAVGMFHGTTAGGWKALDPVFLLMNPVPAYIVQFLDTISCSGGGGPEAARAVANEMQRRIAEALGYTCTGLTRRDKYLMLAGNEGLVDVDKGATRKKTSCTIT